MTERCYQGRSRFNSSVANRPISVPSRGSKLRPILERWHIRGAARHVFRSNIAARRRIIQNFANTSRSSGSLAPPITSH